MRRNPFTVLRGGNTHTLARCAAEVCQLCEETFEGENLKTCRRLQCDLEGYAAPPEEAE